MSNFTFNILQKHRSLVPRHLKIILLAGICLLGITSVFSQCTSYGPGKSSYTVPAGVTNIRIIAYGADGAYYNGPSSGNGGAGATIGATFTVQTGDVITMYVGNTGVYDATNKIGGGGGATSVVITRGTNNYLLLVAGGGGGNGMYNPGNGYTTGGGMGGQSLTTASATGGTSTVNASAAGGGGYFFDGTGWTFNGLTLTGGRGAATIPSTGTLPNSLSAGGTNSNGSSNGGTGFGGGGAGAIAYGGGGGGYAGGNGGNSANNGGQGGSSYFNNNATFSGTLVVQQDGITGGNVNSSAGSLNQNGVADIQIPTGGVYSSVWKGSVNTDINYGLNWCGYFPNTLAPAIIPAGTSNAPVISGIANWSNITINSSASLTVTGTLRIYGSVTNNGTFTATTGTISMNGTAAQIIPAGMFANNTIQNLTINNTAGVTLGGVLNIPGILTPLSGILNTGGYLTLQSSGAGTASVAAGSGTYINGNVTIERYIPALGSRRYVMLTSPVGSPTIYNGWQEGGVTTHAGYGTLITGTSAGSGFDAVSAAGIASIDSYNDNNVPGSKWTGLTNTNTNALNAGRGYLIFMRGDRSTQPNYGAGSNATTLRATGTLQTGTISFTTSGGTPGTPALTGGINKYSLVANPYPCVIDWTVVGRSNLTPAFTLYDPLLATFVTSDGTTVSPNNGNQSFQPAYIQSGQAFFVQNDASGNTPSLTIPETAKTTVALTASIHTIFGTAPKAQLNMNIYKQDSVFADGAVAVFGSGYNRGLGNEDITKFTNFSEMASFYTGGQNLSIEKRPMPAIADTLFVHLAQMQAGTAYKLVIDASGFNSSNIASALLVDQLTTTSQALNLAVKNEYPFTFNSSADSSRFIIVLNAVKTVVVTPPASNDSTAAGLTLRLSPNPVKDQLQVSFHTTNTQHKQIRLINAAGQPVQTVDAGTVADGKVIIPVAGYAAGLYTAELISGSTRVQAAKLVKQ